MGSCRSWLQIHWEPSDLAEEDSGECESGVDADDIVADDTEGDSGDYETGWDEDSIGDEGEDEGWSIGVEDLVSGSLDGRLRDNRELGFAF